MALAPLHRRRILLLAGAAALAPLACSDDDRASGGGGPEGPPAVQIAVLRPAGGPPVAVPPGDDATPLCVERGRDPARTVDVELARVPNFTFSPPGTCGGTPQCGFVVLTVSEAGGPSRRIVSVGRSTSVPLATLGLGAAEGSTLQLRAELFLAGTRAPLVSPDGGTYSDEVTVRLATSCSGDSGVPDGTPDATISDGAIPDGGDAGAAEGGDAFADAGDARDARDAPDDGSDGAIDGAASEASTPDASTADAGTPDTGADAAPARDAMPRDATSG